MNNGDAWESKKYVVLSQYVAWASDLAFGALHIHMHDVG